MEDNRTYEKIERIRKAEIHGWYGADHLSLTANGWRTAVASHLGLSIAQQEQLDHDAADAEDFLAEMLA